MPSYLKLEFLGDTTSDVSVEFPKGWKQQHQRHNAYLRWGEVGASGACLAHGNADMWGHCKAYSKVQFDIWKMHVSLSRNPNSVLTHLAQKIKNKKKKQYADIKTVKLQIIYWECEVKIANVSWHLCIIQQVSRVSTQYNHVTGFHYRKAGFIS